MVTRVDDNDTVVESTSDMAGAAVASTTATAQGATAQGATAVSSNTKAAVPAAVSNEENGAIIDNSNNNNNNSNNNNSSNNNNNNNNKVCRFLITNLQGGYGYANNDYHIDLIQSKHGLYEIVEIVFRILAKEGLTTDSIYSHLWNISFNKKMYKNGWRYQIGIWNRPPKDTDIDEGEPRLFSGLETPLQEGQKGKFGGESASFQYVLESMTDVSPASKDSQAVTYPHVVKIANTISFQVEDDWVTPSQKLQCNKLRKTWVKFYSGNNSWKQVRDDHTRRAFIRGKPCAPVWQDELKIMGLLINADCKFKKSWTNIMQYAFVDRTESACSMRWYQLKKEDYRLKWYGRGKSAAEKISLAKRLAKSMMEVKLERMPKRECHPYANAREKVLREYMERDLAYENGH